MARPREDFKKRFFSFFKSGKENECWNWLGRLSGGGYGHISITTDTKRTAISAHRASYFVFNNLKIEEIGSINGMHVCHKCDNRKCVNPNHLFLGTPKENYDDMVKKGRRADSSGEKNSQHKISWEKANIIRVEYLAGGISQRELGKKYGICQPIISCIVRNTRWVDDNYVGVRTNKEKTKRDRLTKEIVDAIKKDYQAGLSQFKIRDKYNVSQAQVSRVVLNQLEKWRVVK